MDLSRKEFYRLTSKDNPARKQFIRLLSLDDRSGHITYSKAGSTLPELMRDSVLGRNYAPVYDRTLGVVCCVSFGRHEQLRSLLEFYHSGDPEANPFYLGDAWLKNKRGFYISCMEPSVLVVAEGFRPNRYERDTFSMFRIREIPF